MSRRLLEGVITAVRSRVDVTDARVDRITVGEAAVMVELEGVGDAGTVAGLAHRPPGPIRELPEEPDALLEAAAEGGDSPAGAVRRAVAIAGCNAFSAPYIGWTPGDPMALLDRDVSTIATVGLFRPAFGKFSDVDVRVIERRTDREPPEPDALPPGVRVSMHAPESARAAMAGAEVVFITGSALIYGGVDRYLDAVDRSATVVLIGATASFLPAPAFEAGVDVLAGGSVTDVDAARAALKDGACGTGLHETGVTKGYVTAGYPAGIELGTETNATDEHT